MINDYECKNEDYIDENEYVEEEPKLKYIRVLGKIEKIVNTECVSVVKFFKAKYFIGTEWGYLYVSNDEGDILKQSKLHSSTINDIVVCTKSNSCVTCSNDGRVIITNVSNYTVTAKLVLNRPIISISLDPFFPRSGRLITGSDKIEIHKRKFTGSYAGDVISVNDGIVSNILWRNNIIIYCSDISVRMYDLSSNVYFGVIHKPVIEVNNKSITFSIMWGTNDNLIVAIGMSIKTYALKDRFDHFQNVNVKFIEMVYSIKTNYLIYDLCSFSNSIAVITGSDSDENDDTLMDRPHIRLLSSSENTYDETDDVLCIQKYEETDSLNFHLLSNDETLLIYSPHDIIRAMPPTVDDKIYWLQEHERFKEALTLAQQNPGQLLHYTLIDIGMQYLSYLTEHEQYELACQSMADILGNRVDLWESEIYFYSNSFANLEILVPYIPYKTLVLTTKGYNHVLSYFFKGEKYELMRKYLKVWPSNLYNEQEFFDLISDKLKELSLNNSTNKNDAKDGKVNEDIKSLFKSLAYFHILNKDYGQAVEIYLNIKDGEIFIEMEEEFILPYIKGNIAKFMDIDSNETLQLLLKDKNNLFTIVSTVSELTDYSKHLSSYLNMMFSKDPMLTYDFHPLQLHLYAEFHPERLGHFLRNSSNYSLKEALDVTKSTNNMKETVYLLNRTGNSREALRLIVNQLVNVEIAVKFVLDSGDKKLIIHLFELIVCKPKLICTFLDIIGIRVNLIPFFDLIAVGCQIPGIRLSLMKCLDNYHQHLSLLEQTKRILERDIFKTFQEILDFNKEQCIKFQDDVCNICCGALEVCLNEDVSDSIQVFHCKHVYHTSCLPLNFLENCFLCNRNK